MMLAHTIRTEAPKWFAVTMLLPAVALLLIGVTHTIGFHRADDVIVLAGVIPVMVAVTVLVGLLLAAAAIGAAQALLRR